MTKLLQVAVPVVLAILSLMPRVDAPTHAGMYMQMNVLYRKMFHHCGLAHSIHLSASVSDLRFYSL